MAATARAVCVGRVMDKRIKLKQQIEYDDMQSHVAATARETFKRPAYPENEVVHKTALEYLRGQIDVTRRVQGEQRNPD